MRRFKDRPEQLPKSAVGLPEPSSISGNKSCLTAVERNVAGSLQREELCESASLWEADALLMPMQLSVQRNLSRDNVTAIPDEKRPPPSLCWFLVGPVRKPVACLTHFSHQA